MSHQAADYVIYACGACGRRIFTERVYLGQKGICPMCEAEHLVGGETAAAGGQERRGAERVEAPHAQIELAGGGRAASALGRAPLHPVGDLSSTGIGFRMPGLPDRKRLSGHGPPPLEIGKRITIALHAPGVNRGRRLAAEVRRVVPDTESRTKGLYLIGAEFVDVNPSQQAEIDALVERLQN